MTEFLMTDVAVLLCAGGGTRLRPLTDDRPKALMEVGDETILHRAVRLLLAAGIKELVVATGYRHEAVRHALAGCAAQVTFCHNPAFASTQNAVSLHLCQRAVGERAFVKLDGDVLFHPGIVERLLASRAPLATAVERRDDLGDEEMKVTVQGDRILAFGKRLPPSSCYGESIGIERLSSAAGRTVFEALATATAAGRTDLYYEDVYGELIARGLDARVVDISDLPWIEVDTPDDLARARQRVRGGDLERMLRTP